MTIYKITFDGFIPVEINDHFGFFTISEGEAVEMAIDELMAATWYKRDRFINPLIERVVV